MPAGLPRNSGRRQVAAKFDKATKGDYKLSSKEETQKPFSTTVKIALGVVIVLVCGEFIVQLLSIENPFF